MDKQTRGEGSRNLPPDVKEKWQKLGKHHQNKFNAIMKEQGIAAGIDYINTTYATKYPSGAFTPPDQTHQINNGVHEPPASIDNADTTPEGKKKITALLSEDLHRRLSIHSAVTGSSINQIIASLVQHHVPDYQVTVREKLLILD